MGDKIEYLLERSMLEGRVEVVCRRRDRFSRLFFFYPSSQTLTVISSIRIGPLVEQDSVRRKRPTVRCKSR